MAHPRRWHVLHELREAGVQMRTRARVLAIGAHGVRFEVAAQEGATPHVDEAPADSVILAAGLGPNPEPVRRLETAGVPVVAIGDATCVGYLEGAIHGGFRAAVEI
jgi:2,4-dienoyl-CoA reductase (NADPH2)